MVVVVKVVWKHMLLLQELPVRHANFWKSVRMTAASRMDPDEITSKDVYDAAMKNDKLALEIFEFTGNILGEAFADFVAFSSQKRSSCSEA